MKDFIIEYGSVALAIVGLLILLYATAMDHKQDRLNSYEKGYIDACKDFYKGKLKYDLVDNGDGTRDWKKLEGKK